MRRGRIRKSTRRDSNTRPRDLQSHALPLRHYGRWEYELAPTKYIKRRYALTGESRKQLNALHTPSYFYRIDRRHPDRRDRNLASEQAAFELGVKTHRGKRGMEDAAEELYKSSCREYERARDAGADEDYVMALHGLNCVPSLGHA
ncbi:hypothetical protein VTN00DRAFT_630 [Thermoascus crustaceus]|uniref:uncharacterized protein n=1 Tax=Thermoascus crustaceus TaxID=5088 RepID=UPI0037442243